MWPQITSLKLAEELKKKDTSLVGTVNRVRREVPTSATKTNSDFSTAKVFRRGDTTLNSYRCKQNKSVIVLSRMRLSVTAGSGDKRKPEFDNSTKYGVVVDQTARKSTGKAGSRRWPFQVLYNTLDLAAVNAWILYNDVNKMSLSRRAFILQLAEKLRAT